MGDTTTAMGWLKRSNLKEKNELDRKWEEKHKIAAILDSKIELY